MSVPRRDEQREIMTTAPRQLILDLAHRSALDREDFLVSQSNAAAVELIDAAQTWPHGALMLTGPQGSGKSHLANVFRLAHSSDLIEAAEIGEEAIGRLEASGALVVENLDRGIADERVLFHLLNMGRQGRGLVLMTSRLAPGQLTLDLPDLRSRARALPVAQIEAPDDFLLQAVLVKLFADRQLTVEPAVVRFLAMRMERSMQTANAVVSEIDQLALAMRRKVSKQLAQAALKRIADAGS
jgi:chromosomal replication initiation ATPase DnaA